MTVATASLLAACSNSIERFQNAYDNPSDADPVYTASVPKKVQQPAIRKARPVIEAPQAPDEDTIIESPVARAPLPKKQPVQQYDYTENYKKTYKQPALTAPKPKYNAPSYDEPDLAQADETEITPAPKATRPAKASNGTVTVGQGMTLYSIARANNVDAMELASYNKMKAPYHVWQGQKLRLPGGVTADAGDDYVAPAAKPRKIAAAEPAETEITPVKKGKSGNIHTVAGGETLYSLGRKYGVSPFVIADANGLAHDQSLRLGQKVKIPGGSSQQAAAETEITPAPVKKSTKRAPLSLAEDETDTADTTPSDTADEAPAQTANLKTKKKQPAPVADEAPAEEKTMAQPPAPVAGALNLRWPLKGKVISNFGPKTNGLKNEGINIAVPEGTSVRAAEGGVVAYAGNELKGYGNLVLIRHAGGYVTAYAHAKELMVKRGDTVKRGDVIAKAGQTGAVSSPQLHFEVRKGATALDPIKHLSSVTAMN
jgi:murein DD-endopeptidase MepM/ murein hydrolase activator NlpD